ncbi:MAG: guanylate kinase [Pseudomonadota bacterium]
MSGNQAASSGRLVVVAAPSGAGKTTLTHALIERMKARGTPAAFSVSFTTRPPRSGERNGVHYHFVDEVMFEAMVRKNEFLEHAHVFGRRYGTGRVVTEALLAEGKQIFLDIDWQGARQVRERLPGQTLLLFVLPPSLEELERRLRGRGQDSEETIRRRMKAAEEEIHHAPEFDHRVVNDDFNRALNELERLVLPVSP